MKFSKQGQIEKLYDYFSIKREEKSESTIGLKAKEPNQTEVDYNLKDIFFPDEVNTLTWKEDNVSLKKIGCLVLFFINVVDNLFLLCS